MIRGYRISQQDVKEMINQQQDHIIRNHFREKVPGNKGSMQRQRGCRQVYIQEIRGVPTSKCGEAGKPTGTWQGV